VDSDPCTHAAVSADSQSAIQELQPATVCPMSTLVGCYRAADHGRRRAASLARRRRLLWQSWQRSLSLPLLLRPSRLRRNPLLLRETDAEDSCMDMLDEFGSFVLPSATSIHMYS
jgi:hypothetical protein